MSRVGKQAISLDQGVEVSLSGQSQGQRAVTVKGKGKSLAVSFPHVLDLKREPGKVSVVRKNEEAKTKALHGLTRSLIQNAVTGILKGWSKTLELRGVGYKAAVSGKNLDLNLGYSHPIVYKIPDGLEIKVEKQTKLIISGADKELVGRAANQIRSYRPVEPYLGKGVRYAGETLKLKKGKKEGKK